MQRKSIVAVAIVATLLALPLATAEWYGRGFYEPDTAQDRDAARVFTNPDVNPNANVNQIYFSGFPHQFYPAALTAAPNPNVGALGSQIAPYPTSYFAILGVWKDCNHDGYIGLAEGVGGALPENYVSRVNSAIATVNANANTEFEGITSLGGTPDYAYTAMALPEDHVCPSASMFNDGVTVREFWPIGPDFPAPQGAEEGNNTYAYNIADETARVWADFGLPGDKGAAACPVNPQPRGTTQSTGGFLRYTDCMTGWRVTGNINTVAHLAGLDGLAFDDAAQERPDRSNSPLNIQNPWGQPGGDTMFDTWDCNADPVTIRDPDGGRRDIIVDDPTGGQLSGPQPAGAPRNATVFNGTTHQRSVNVADDDGEIFHVTYMPNVPSGVNPDGDLASTYDQFESGANNCDTTEAPNCGNLIYVGPDQHTGGDIYCYLEADFEANGATRVQTDMYYDFTEGSLGTHWRGQPGYAVSRNPYINRDTLEPWGSTVVTYYAYVSPLSGQMVNSATDSYGSLNCFGTDTTPATGGFDCDAGNWWPTAAGVSAPSYWQVSVGQPYNLIDIDCYDFTVVRDVPVNTGSLGRECQR